MDGPNYTINVDVLFSKSKGGDNIEIAYINEILVHFSNFYSRFGLGHLEYIILKSVQSNSTIIQI